MLTVADDLVFDDLDQAFSVGLWIKPSVKKNDWQPLIAKENNNGGQRTFGLYIAPGSMQVHYSIFGSNYTNYAKTSDGSLNENQWNHVMMTFDGTKAYLYLNGSLTNSDGVAPATMPCDANTPIKIGNEVSAFSPFIGSLDKVTIHNIAFRADEVRDLYNYQASWFDVAYQHSIRVDLDDPAVEIGLADNMYLRADPDIVLSISAYDHTSAVKKVQYSFDNSTWYTATSRDGDAWIFTFTPASDAPYTITARADDTVGHVVTDTATFNVDNTPPDALSLSNAGALLPGVDSVWLRVQCSDAGNGAGCARVQVDILDRHGTCINGFQDPQDYPLPVPLYGTYYVNASASDVLGNGPFTDTIGSIRLDGYGPVADVTLPSGIISNSLPTQAYLSFEQRGADSFLKGTISDTPDPVGNKILHMHFEEQTCYATPFADSSGNLLAAECVNCIFSWRGEDGQYGRAFDFTGSNHLRIPDNAPLGNGGLL